MWPMSASSGRDWASGICLPHLVHSALTFAGIWKSLWREWINEGCMAQPDEVRYLRLYSKSCRRYCAGQITMFFGNPPSFTFSNTTETSRNFRAITQPLRLQMTYIFNLRPVNQLTDWTGKSVLKTCSWMQASLKENLLGALRIPGLITEAGAPFAKG